MICITGGGTGGHLVIAKTIKEELNKRGIKPLFIGSSVGQDRAWFEDDEGWSEKFFLNSSGVFGGGIKRKVFSLFNILKLSFVAKKILKDKKVTKVFCVGGYSAAPASFASLMLRADLYIHEQNAIYGGLNKLLKPFAKDIFSSYDKLSKIKSYPVPKIFFDKARVRNEVKSVIFLGGSGGSESINKFVMKNSHEIIKNGYKIIHQTGKRDFEMVKKYYKKHSIDVEFFAFSKDIASKIEKSDFAISRSGASALWELVSSQIPTLFIPFSQAVSNHQYHNAKFIVDKNLAFMCSDEELSLELLFDLFKKDIKTISKNLEKINQADASKEIVDIVLS